MPKLWDATIDEHRRTVEAAILDAAATVIAERGLATVTMSSIAQRAGIGRATLYKYFGDLDAIMVAWHERQVTAHLRHVEEVAAAATDPEQRLPAVLRAYAELSGGGHDHRGSEVPGMPLDLHGAAHMHEPLQRLRTLITKVVAESAEVGAVRGDIPHAEMADYCLHALSAARFQPSSEGRDRLVTLTLDGLRPATATRAHRSAKGVPR